MTKSKPNCFGRMNDIITINCKDCNELFDCSIKSSIISEYQKNEFCLFMDCRSLLIGKGCTTNNDRFCHLSAKEFHTWLKDNGYKIIKINI